MSQKFSLKLDKDYWIAIYKY